MNRKTNMGFMAGLLAFLLLASGCQSSSDLPSSAPPSSLPGTLSPSVVPAAETATPSPTSEDDRLVAEGTASSGEHWAIYRDSARQELAFKFAKDKANGAESVIPVQQALQIQFVSDERQTTVEYATEDGGETWTAAQ